MARGAHVERVPPGPWSARLRSPTGTLRADGTFRAVGTFRAAVTFRAAGTFRADVTFRLLLAHSELAAYDRTAVSPVNISSGPVTPPWALDLPPVVAIRSRPADARPGDALDDPLSPQALCAAGLR